MDRQARRIRPLDIGACLTPEGAHAAPSITSRRPSERDRAGNVRGLGRAAWSGRVPFKDLETATRSRLAYRALTDALNALVNDGAVRRVTEKPARLAITEAGRKRLDEYRS